MSKNHLEGEGGKAPEQQAFKETGERLLSATDNTSGVNDRVMRAANLTDADMSAIRAQHAQFANGQIAIEKV